MFRKLVDFLEYHATLSSGFLDELLADLGAQCMGVLILISKRFWLQAVPRIASVVQSTIIERLRDLGVQAEEEVCKSCGGSCPR